MKKILAFILTFCFLLYPGTEIFDTNHTALASNNASFVAGDMNNDGVSNVKDVVFLGKRVAGWNVSADELITDTNSDGKTNLSDVVHLARFLLGWCDISMNGVNYGKYDPANKSFKEIENYLKLSSRASIYNNELCMQWSYSGFTIEGRFSGDVTITDVYVTNPVLAYAVLDEDFENAVQLTVNGGDITILKDIEPGYHTIQFFKATDVNNAVMTAGGIKYNGVLLKRPEDKNLKIQFIGDSITCGSGLYTTSVEPNTLLASDITKGYAFKVAQHFNADMSVLSVSGGTICARTPSLKDYYMNTFYNISGEYNFSSETQPDVVIIALGTNDTPTYDPSQNGGLENQFVLKRGITNTLNTVRAKHPNATIIWCYGMMATKIADVYEEAVEEFAETDGNTYYKFVPRNDCNGSNGHPTPDGHTTNANIIISFIEENGIIG